jgi:hypothetical protein
MSTRFQFDSYARELDKPHRLNDVQLRRAVFICILLLVALVVVAIKATAQDVPPGALLSETVLRISAGSSGTGTQPPFAPTTRPASFDSISMDAAAWMVTRTAVPLQGGKQGAATVAYGASAGWWESSGPLTVQPAPEVRMPEGSTPSRVHSHNSLLPLALTYAGLQAVDLMETTSALNSGRYREANGALSGIAGSPWKLGLVKGAVTSGSLLGIYAIRKQHPKVSKWLLVGVVGAQSAVVAWNYNQLRTR